ncbi:MarR family transcriptional regulator [Thalassospiraceae bacterium LMO-JJ14]|nr:MarR family transcriptional regulator [Thalassospiraceae bacterium LMO-JJ14]
MAKNSPPALSEGRSLALMIQEAARLQRTVFDRRVHKIGFTRTQWQALRQVIDLPGVSQSELAELLEVEKASAGRLIDKLEAFGWLERRPDKADRRVKRIYATELGRRIHRKITPVAEAMVEEELSGLSKREREMLSGLLLNIKHRLQEMALANDLIDLKELEKDNA